MISIVEDRETDFARELFITLVWRLTLVAGKIAGEDPGLAAVRVVILTTFDLDEYVFEAIRAGAAGFLVKDTGAAELLRAVRVVAGGEALLSPGVTRRLISEFASCARPAGPVPGIEELTPREREVVALIAAGLSNDEIATQLFISTATAKTHATRSMAKLRARDRAQLVVLAYQAAWPTPAGQADRRTSQYHHGGSVTPPGSARRRVRSRPCLPCLSRLLAARLGS